METAYPKDESGLIEACIRKDLKAWSLLVARYSRLVDLAAAGRLKKYGFILPKEDIEDIRQDVFASIWSGDKLKSASNPADISNWLAVVAGNMAINRIRSRKKREPLRTIPIYKKFKEKFLAEILPSKALRAEDDAAETELARRIDGAIDGLPAAREKLIIKLHLIHGKKHAEIIEMLGLPKGTVCSSIKRAKDKLKIALEDLLIIFAIFLPLLASLHIGG